MEEKYLELQQHWKDAVDLLFEADVSGKPKMRHNRFRIICVDLDFIGNGEVVQGEGPLPLISLYIARVNQNHFIPLIRRFA